MEATVTKIAHPVQLIKHTPLDHHDYFDLVQAHSQIKAFADFINASKKCADRADRVKDLYSRIEGLPEDIIFTIGVGVVKYGLLWEKEISKNKKSKKRIFLVLVNTHLLVNSVKDEKKKGIFRSRLLISLSDVKTFMEDGDLIIECTNRGELANDKPSFYRLHHDAQSLSVWYLALQKTITNLTGTNFHPTDSPNFSPQHVRDEQQQDSQQFMTRQKIIHDFMKKERIYLHNIKLLKRFFSATSNTLLLNILSIVMILISTHKMLLTSLWFRMENYQLNTVVGDLFLNCLDGFQAYEQFCSSWGEGALATLKKSEFAERLKKFETENHMTVPEACELIPQRIPNISYIVSEILRSIPSNHEDFQNLRLVSQKLEQLKTNILAKPKRKKTLKVSGWNKNT